MPVVADGVALVTPGDVGASGGALSFLDPEYQARQLALKQATAFQGGLPTDANGNTDWNAAAMKLLRLGDYGNASNLMQLGLRQGALSGGLNLDDPLGRGAGAAAAAPGAGTPDPGTPGASPSGASPLAALSNAVGSVESSNNYAALGPKTASGDRAYGKHQVMGANVGPWTQEALGTALTPQQFLADPQAQEAVFQNKFGGYLRQYGNIPDASSMWFSGRPIAKAQNASDQLGTTVPAYVGKVLAALQGGAGQGAPAATNSGAGQPQVIPGAGPAPRPPQMAQNGASDAPQAGMASPQAQPQGQPGQPQGASSSYITPGAFAAKQRPNDSTLGNRIADALGIDPSEGVDFSDPTVRKMVLPVLRAPIPSTSGSSTVTATDQAPSGQHPFVPPPGAAAAPPPARGGQAFQPIPAPIAAAGGQPATAPQPGPAQAPLPPSVAPATPQGGPDLPDLPRSYQDVGGGARYVQDLTQRAAQLQAAGINEGAAPLLDRAKQFQAELVARQTFQNNLALAQARANDRYNAQNSPQAIAAAGQRAGAEATARAAETLVSSQQPDGSIIQIPQSQALAAAAGGSPITSAQPGYVTQGQGNLLAKLNDGSSAYKERQIAGQRLDTLSSLLETYQTGANSEAFNNAAAAAASIGFPVPTSARINPAAMQQFVKNGYANVLSTIKEQGNAAYAAEVSSAVKSNPNPDLQPEANAAMVSQMQGIKRWNDQNFRDYSGWYHANRGASDDADFQTGWADQHPLSGYVDAAEKDIAPMGIPLPSKGQLVDGQAYRVNGSKVRWDAGAGQFTPYSGPTPVGGAPARGQGAQPPAPGARQAPDGNWYVPDPSRAGKYLQVRA